MEKILYMAVGPSGSGKSTVFNKLKKKNPTLELYSWDALRHEFYDADDYSRAFELSCRDKGFKKKIDDRFNELLVKYNDIYVDNTNLTPKRRKPLIDAAKQHGYKVIAITFDVSLKTLLERQQTRGDKCVPNNVVVDQFNNYRSPTFSEGFDRIITSDDIK